MTKTDNMNWPRTRDVMAICSLVLLSWACTPTNAQPVSNITFTAFDTETTGLDSHSGRIVEIGAVRFCNGVKIEQKAWLINPGIPIPESATRIHGITDEAVADSPHFKEVLAEFIEFVDGDMLLAHNARFDIRFLSAEAERNDIHAPTNAVVDTLRLARTWFPDADGFSLPNLLDHIGLQEEDFHRGLADAEHVMQLFLAGTTARPPEYDRDDLLRDAGGSLTFEK
jgi:DNA polymerase III epsilon subunit